MNTWAAWAPTIVSVLTMIFVAGKTYGRINGQEITLKRHDDTLVNHGSRIEDLEYQAKIEDARRDGFQRGRESWKKPTT